MTETKPKPTHEIRLGRVRAAVWQNANDKGTWSNVTFSKLYLDKDGQWKDTTSFGKEDLLLLAEAARLAANLLYRDEAEQARPLKEEAQA
jgi:hypothetical protein